MTLHFPLLSQLQHAITSMGSDELSCGVRDVLRLCFSSLIISGFSHISSVGLCGHRWPPQSAPQLPGLEWVWIGTVKRLWDCVLFMDEHSPAILVLLPFPRIGTCGCSLIAPG